MSIISDIFLFFLDLQTGRTMELAVINENIIPYLKFEHLVNIAASIIL